jgi:DNA replication protein DnaC
MDTLLKANIISDERLANFAGIPNSAMSLYTFNTFKKERNNEIAFNACCEFVCALPKHHFLTLLGECGRGKSHLAMAALIFNMRKNGGRLNSCYYQTEALLDDLRSKFNNRNIDEHDNYDILVNFVKKVNLLVLDDFGAEKGTEWARAKLDEIVDERYLYKRKTIVTSNLPLEQFPPRIASRLSEGIVIALDCNDYRQRISIARNK